MPDREAVTWNLLDYVEERNYLRLLVFQQRCLVDLDECFYGKPGNPQGPLPARLRLLPV